MTEDEQQIFRQRMQIDQQIDENNKMILVYLLHKILDVSYEHDQYITNETDLLKPLLKESETWVVTQYAIDINRLPSIGEVIEISTRVTNSSSFFVNRFFEVYNKEQTLVEIHSQYVGIDIETREAIRIDNDALQNSGLIDSSKRQRFNKIKVLPDFKALSTEDYKIQDSDIDYNHHVNNTVYVKWCLDALPENMVDNYQLVHVDVKYGHEILPDDKINIQTFFKYEEDKLFTIHIINNLSTSTVACEIQFEWHAN